jgi:uncharacterized protein (TIRG00374 family)
MGQPAGQSIAEPSRQPLDRSGAPALGRRVPVGSPDGAGRQDLRDPSERAVGAPEAHPAGGAEGDVPAGDAKAATTPTASPPTGPHESHRARLLRWWRSPPLRWAVAIIVLLFVLEYLLLPEIANARKSIYLLGRVNIIGLIAALALEAASLLAYAELSHTVFSPGAPRRLVLFRVNMSSLAVSHVVPGGTAPGTAVAYRLLTELDVPSGTVAFGLATQGVGSAVVLNAIFWLALLISIPLIRYNPIYGFGAIVGLILFALFAGTVFLLTRGQHRGLDRLHAWAAKVPLVNPDRVSALVQTIADRLQILLRDRALLVHALEWAAANWLLDAASLWVFVLSFGHLVSPIDLLVAYGLANILAVIPITPGGLGVVEGILIPTLVGFHVPKAIATLGVLGYRLVNFWLPIPAGGAAYLSLRSGREGEVRRAHLLRRHTRTRPADESH